jgi:hypothetical protein
LVGKSEGSRPLGIHWHRWEDNIKIDLKYGGRVWTGFIWLRIGTGGGMIHSSSYEKPSLKPI